MTNLPSICSGVNSNWKETIGNCHLDSVQSGMARTKKLNSAPWPLTLTFTIILPTQMIKLQSVATIPVHQRPWLCIVCYCQRHSLLFLGLTCGQSLAIIFTPTRMWHSISMWSKTCWICQKLENSGVVWIELGQLWRWISQKVWTVTWKWFKI